MSNIVPFGSTNLPAHLQDTAGLDSSWNDVGGGGFPRLKMKGLTLEASLNGGVVASSEPGQAISVVLLKPSKLGRTFYEGQYEEGSKDLPTCYSLDNVKPAADAQQPQCSTCDLCPMNVKGSGQVKDTKACRYRQTLGVWIPGDNTDDVIFQVNLPATSIFPDEENKQGFMPLQRYVRKLKNLRIDPSKIWTEIVVDGYADPKRILLKPVGYISDPQDYEIVKEHLHSPELDRILNAGPIDGDQAAATSAFGEQPDHLKTQPANKPVVPTGSQDTVNPFTGEIIYTDEPMTDDNDTYWMDESSQEVVKLVAGTNLPVEYAGIVEVGVEEYNAYMQELKEKREAAERADREAKEKAAADAAAAAAAQAGGGRRRGGAAAATPAPNTAEQPAAGRRRRGAAASTPAPTPEPEQTTAPAGGRRRGAAAATPAPTPEPEQTAATTGTGRRRAASAATTTTAAPAETPAAGGRRRGAAAAQEAAAQAPADEQPRVAGSGLDPDMANALDAALGGDMD